MALFQCNFYSEAILSNVNVNVILPVPDCDDYTSGDLKGYKKGSRFQTLYLLHGAYGDYSDWLRNTRIEKYAQENRVAVVMASADNSFYLDLKHGGAYCRYFEQELPAFVESVFPLAEKREDRFIAGLSMGGYGALRIALRNPEMFGAAVGFSGAYDLVQIKKDLDGMHKGSCNVFSSLNNLESEEWEIAKIAKRAQENKKQLPALMISCGSEDYTIKMSRALKVELEQLQIDFTYEEHPGEHNWDYWEKHIQTALQWLPLKKAYL